MALLEVGDLRTYFHTEEGVAKAVDGVSFRVERGEVLGVVGESGCGKSVTSLSIMGLVTPPGRIEAGSQIRFDGRELTELGGSELRALRGDRMSMIFQEPMTSLNPVHTAGAQIAEAVRAHRRMSRKAARARAVELLARVGIPAPDRRVDEYPHQLSGGMRQRVMIAMALANDPDLLIADEPTTALDVTIQAQILELLATLRRDTGMGVLLITHDLGVVAESCDRVVVMYAGQIVEEGPVEAIFRRPSHPYTRGLLAAVPRPDRREAALAVIPGTVPPATRWPAGCRFQARCPYAWDACDTMPQPLGVAEGHTARCWLVREPGRRAEVERAGGGFGGAGAAGRTAGAVGERGAEESS